ncbi:MAG: COX15/CtaA family protein [Hyphomicrobiales bacterium]|nr:COX15/CtaA family protein [Hyphomicrobiales bacterium]
MHRQSAPNEPHARALRLWLWTIAALVVLMVLVGGATRLTDSGLSIVEWRPVTGTVPPLSEADWNSEFAKYRTSSEYELVNKGMTLEAFKRIYWWEWGHRLLGRLIGIAFVLPLLFFHLRGWIPARLKWRLWLIFGLGGLQGAIGWWMVASGLVGRVDVAQERLATHLTMACLILMAIVSTAQTLAPARRRAVMPARLLPTAVAILALLVIQIALGGLVAGLKAGLVYDTWPLIDGAFIPSLDRLLFNQPWWSNLVDNHLTVQFVHRMTAYLLLVLAALHAVDCARSAPGQIRAGALALLLVLLTQATLGILTLLWNVPITLALLHQVVAVLALIVATLHAGQLHAARPARVRSEGDACGQPSGELSMG